MTIDLSLPDEVTPAEAIAAATAAASNASGSGDFASPPAGGPLGRGLAGRPGGPAATTSLAQQLLLRNGGANAVQKAALGNFDHSEPVQLSFTVGSTSTTSTTTSRGSPTGASGNGVAAAAAAAAEGEPAELDGVETLAPVEGDGIN